VGLGDRQRITDPIPRGRATAPSRLGRSRKLRRDDDWELPARVLRLPDHVTDLWRTTGHRGWPWSPEGWFERRPGQLTTPIDCWRHSFERRNSRRIGRGQFEGRPRLQPDVRRSRGQLGVTLRINACTLAYVAAQLPVSGD
jgi:hypothetical protein